MPVVHEILKVLLQRPYWKNALSREISTKVGCSFDDRNCMT
jgi:hypothetical protein